MKKTLRHTLHLLKYNFKTLFYFELIYRALGVLIVFPLVQFLLYTSIKVSGYTYITNALLLEYLKNPFTILSMAILLVILSFYMMIEMIMMSMIFDYGSRDETLGLKELIFKGSKRVMTVLKRYHIKIFFPALFFFILVELFHVVGIAQTINIPNELMLIINQKIWLQLIILGLIIGVFIVFIESVYLIHYYSIDQMTISDAKRARKQLLKGNRLKLSIEFILTNTMLNIILYLFYAFLVFVIGLTFSLTRGPSYALSMIINVFYSIYGLVGFLATITLVPINFALITARYEEGRHNPTIIEMRSENKIKMKPFKNERILKWILIVFGLVLFVTNLVAINNVTQANSQIEVLNYAEIIAHRGQSSEAPENTLSAIKLAIENNIDIVELDVRQTVDHIPVIIHDATTKRTTNDSSLRYVNVLTVDELKQLDAGSWFSLEFAEERIPTLEEVLELASGKSKLFLELKDQNEIFEQKVLELLERYEMMNQVMILSFSNQQLSRLKTMNYEVQTVFLVHSFWGRYDDLLNAPYADNYGLSYNFYQSNEELIDLIHQSNKKAYIWTVNDEASLKKVVDSDVDGIITDYPLLAREIAYSKNAPEFLIQVLRRWFKKNEQGLS